jgi:hypothetical protein
MFSLAQIHAPLRFKAMAAAAWTGVPRELPA